MTLERPPQATSEAMLREEIERTRAHLVDTASALRRRLRDSWRPQTWVRRHPGFTLGVAFAAGLWLGIRRR